MRSPPVFCSFPPSSSVHDTRDKTRNRQKYHHNEKLLANLKEALDAALVGSEILTLPLIAKRLQCSVSTLKRHFPALSAAITQRYHDTGNTARIEHRLKEILASEGVHISMRSIAREFGRSTSSLHGLFPELCAEISMRNRAYLIKRREMNQQIQKDIMGEEISQAMLKLHNEGLYPSSNRVMDILGKSDYFRDPEGYRIWKRMLADLGWVASSSDNPQ